MSEESEKSLRESRLKHAASLVASLVALVTAVSAFVKPQDQSVNQESYEQLSASIKQLSEQQQKNHDDLVALRGYTEAAVQLAASPEVAVVAVDAGAGRPSVPTARPVVRIRRPPPAASASAGVLSHVEFSDAGTFVAHNMVAEPLPEPPPLSDSPKPVDPPSFPDVVRKAAAKK